jgi:large subunit ribosomal protein L6
MSRVGKKPISIPSGVEVKVSGQTIEVLGPKGKLQKEIRPEIKVEVKDNEIVFTPQIESKQTSAFWGLSRSLVFNMIEGVTKGFEKKLEIEGLGYRASKEGENLVLQVGFTHPVTIEPPAGVEVSVDKKVITVFGIDKGRVTQTAAKIRKVRPPEPYKGKGIRYQGEQIRRKAGKKIVTAEG